jgi:diguanylate cyclase (GGDEF)-like protein
MRFPNLPIRSKFMLTLAVLIPALTSVALIGYYGLEQTQAAANRIYGDNNAAISLTNSLRESVDEAAETALRLIPTVNSSSIAQLNAKLDGIEVTVAGEIAALRQAHAHDPFAERERVVTIESEWGAFEALRGKGALDRVGFDRAAVLRDQVVADSVSTIFDRIAAVTDADTRLEEAQAAASHERAASAYHRSVLLLLLIVLLAVGAGLACVLLLTRNVVPRIRDYASFAQRVSAGELGARLAPRGRDEIAQLGRALNEMVSSRQAEEAQAASHAEFTEMAQSAEAEEEAYELLRRQLERTIPGSRAVVLNRNNSDDRLEPRTTLVDDDAQLAERLVDAQPRSCLAVRFGRTHHEGLDRQPLLRCEICGKASFSTCEPLLVGGEVIGAALVQHSQALSARDDVALKTSVSQAAPTLANLRNLALAEIRAATDSLTGLPNSRAARDTLKRMVAQASRTTTPLAALLLDLDHFKQINDSFGHERGDDVLAAVGTILGSTLRESDFVARYGGEEFLVLLPDTGHDEALLVAEKIRTEIAAIAVAGVNREITASLGVAVIPDDAGDAATVVRYADRALYTAKAAGRNRVEAARAALQLAADQAGY